MARTTGATGAPGTLIKTGQSRSLAKDVACIPPSYDRLPELAAAGVRQDYPCPASWANSPKPRSVCSSGQISAAIRPSFGPESMAMSMWTWKKSRLWSYTNSPISHAYRC
ncbi:uncharacterized protein [Drosophila pseudoobscura]|uniref:Uncharacterized protein isoform X3 n=1 Tax=Drosophila pseudoobscura pseudoobscura TaxID=46245 RepID=A0A6I8VTY5_DROPS|nr:uncharacterized protein LOC117183724 isoform X3 [Drosophila pseudoobscura]